MMSDDLGLSRTQLKSIGMLVHALYNNPKVLFAPNNSAATLIISKVICHSHTVCPSRSSVCDSTVGRLFELL